MLAIKSISTFSSRRVGLLALRLFSDSTNNEGNSEIDKNVILQAALQFVPEYGWSIKAIEKGAKEVNLPEIVHGLFPRGGANLIDHFETESNLQLIKYLEETSTCQNNPHLRGGINLEYGGLPGSRASINQHECQGVNSSIKGGRLVQSAVETRLKMLIPYIKQWPEAMFIKAYPNNVFTSLEISSKMFDDIWYYAGDRSTDMNWYTKRGLLAAVYCSAELYMVQDNSVNFEDTWGFLRRRFEDTRTITECRQQLESFMGGAYNFSTAAFTTARNIIGLGSRNR